MAIQFLVFLQIFVIFYLNSIFAQTQPSSIAQTQPSSSLAVNTVSCDILVAGGSLSSLAAAVSAANSSKTSTVCFLELTDTPGGQMISSNVPAIDFGPSNRIAANLPSSFNELVFGELMPGDTNLGNCWVSTKCFTQEPVLNTFIFPLLKRFSNLKTYLRTAVSYATRDAITGAVTSIRAISRTPKDLANEWTPLTSTQLYDWYDPVDSNAYTKVSTDFVVSKGGVVIEATEFGDVLMTGGFSTFAQGIESPTEAGTTDAISYCGQGTTIPFYVSYLHTEAPSPDPWPPGNSNPTPSFSQQGLSWERDWSYRRVDAPVATTKASPGETSVINVGGGNDLSTAYIFLDGQSEELKAQRATPGAWRSGVNLTTYSEGEQRAFGFYHWFKSVNASKTVMPFLNLNASLALTTHGLSKLPYLRDTRRSPLGIDGFRVFKSNLTTPDPHSNKTAYKWPDAVAIGQYFYADIHKMTNTSCPYPNYIISGDPVLPYYIPFRALTVQESPNLLVAGKSLATTFFANAAIRLHPEEWSSGVAAGAAAAVMFEKQFDSSEAYANINLVQAAIKQLGSPIEWTF
jgi:hypothetical protein